MTIPTRVRINLESKEFEIEGTENFVNTFTTRINEFLDSLKHDTQRRAVHATQTKVDSGVAVKGIMNAQNGDMPETFGEYFFDVPKDASGKDQVLVAGHFAQLSSEDNSFTTSDASSLLLDQSVKLANPSNEIKRNLDSKNLIKLGKGKFRVSRDGVDHIDELRSKKSE